MLQGCEFDHKEEEIFMRRGESFIVVDFDKGMQYAAIAALTK